MYLIDHHGHGHGHSHGHKEGNGIEQQDMEDQRQPNDTSSISSGDSFEVFYPDSTLLAKL